MPDFNDMDWERWARWVKEAQGGDKKSYESFLKEIYPFIRRRLEKKMGHLPQVDDVTQECLIGIHQSLPTYDPQRPLRPWVLGIMKFKIFDYFRKLGKEREEIKVIDIESVTKSVSLANCPTEESEMFNKILATLPKKLKEAVWLTKVKGLSYPQAAQKERISEAALRKRISRAYRVIGEKLGEKVGSSRG